MFVIIDSFLLLNLFPTVEECDATTVSMKYNCRLHKNFHHFISTRAKLFLIDRDIREWLI